MSAPRVAVVTGAAGFIGSHMVDLLLGEGYQVRALDDLSCGRLDNLAHLAAHPRLVFETRDVRQVQPEERFFQGADAVFHFAGIGDIVPSIERPLEYLSVNVMGTIAVLEASRRVGVRKFVYAASSSCYGIATELPTSETAPIHPRYPYALSKYLGEQAVMHWGLVYRLPVVSLRIFNAYGPRSRTTGAYGAVFGVFLAQKLAGKPLTIVGDGTQTRDFVFVTDVVRAFFLAAGSDRAGEIYNVGAGRPQSITRLVELLGGEAAHLPKRPGEPDCTWANITKTQQALGWEPRVSFEQGVATMLQQIDRWQYAPVWTPETIADATREWFACLT